jgi:choline kinase
VVLVDEPDEIIPPPVYDEDDDRSPARQHKASISGKKMTGRPPILQSSSTTSLHRQISNVNIGSTDSTDPSTAELPQPDAKKLLAQVAEWLHHEKAKRLKTKKSKSRSDKQIALDEDEGEDVNESERPSSASRHEDSDLDLSTLEGILAGYMTASAGSTPRLLPKSGGLLSRKGSIIAKKFKRNSAVAQSSDTEFFGEDILVPNVEANLDNSKTLSYTGGAADDDTEAGEKAKKKDQKCWDTFKTDILRLTHTLKLKGWRRIPMEQGGELEVSRLSGKWDPQLIVHSADQNLQQEPSQMLYTL